MFPKTSGTQLLKPVPIYRAFPLGEILSRVLGTQHALLDSVEEGETSRLQQPGVLRFQQDTHSMRELRSAGSALKREEDLREVDMMRRKGLEKRSL